LLILACWSAALLPGEFFIGGPLLASLPRPLFRWPKGGPRPGALPLWRPSATQRWSSPLLRLQVVCPRRCGDGRRRWYCVGSESTMRIFLSNLGAASALRLPACNSQGAQAPDCLDLFCARVLFAFLEALSSNRWFACVIKARVSLCYYVPAAV
jgi:hypothetical protein